MLELRPFQKEALAALSKPGHVLCVAPTGSGKSLIYERASEKPGRKTVLVTPLVALGRQQRARLGERSLELPPERNQSGVWVTSPERLHAPGIADRLNRWQPDFLVFDECHCFWEWGERFRPAFRSVVPLMQELEVRSSLWLTATLPLDARLELRALLDPLRELGAFDLPRLDLRCVRVPWSERADALVGWLLQQRGPGILFVPTRESALRVARLIAAAGVEAVFYHAGMGAEERRAVEALLERRMPAVVVATSAFGMGMHYPALQWAALWQAPPSLLALAQSVGRVGRGADLTARALVFWDEDDFKSLEWMVRGSARSARQLTQVREFLRSRICRRSALRAHFADSVAASEDPGAEARCGLCDICARETSFTERVY